ncbi:hypothetical protein U1Q18_007750, partial [Sarracenia purpurea var. burkii]
SCAGGPTGGGTRVDGEGVRLPVAVLANERVVAKPEIVEARRLTVAPPRWLHWLD